MPIFIDEQIFYANWSYLNLRCHSFDFHLCNTVVAVALFAVADVVVATVVVPVALLFVFILIALPCDCVRLLPTIFVYQFLQFDLSKIKDL